MVEERERRRTVNQALRRKRNEQSDVVRRARGVWASEHERSGFVAREARQRSKAGDKS